MNALTMKNSRMAACVGALALFMAAFVTRAQTVEYIHTDALGTPIAVTDANRVVIERSEYEPYGKLLNRPLTDGPGFTGHVQDAATGMTYMQQRYYDPMIGRFLSVDPVTANSGTGGNFNRYWYANNNPYRFTDPDGRASCEKAGADCDQFWKGMQKVDESLKSEKLSGSERNQLQNSRDYYGAKDDPNNNVIVKFASLEGKSGTATDKEVTIDLNATKRQADSRGSAEANSVNALAKIIVHEGDHGARWKSGEAFGISRLDLEKSGYRAQAIFQKASGFLDGGASQNGWTPAGDINENTIRSQAAFSTIVACGSITGCDGN